jgi:hypothetical protein
MNSYTRRRLHGRWLEVLVGELDPAQGIPAIVKKRGALDGWSDLRAAPSGRAEDELEFAVQIAAGAYDNPLVTICLNRCLEVNAAGQKDARWTTWWAHTRNVEHGRFVSATAVAEAWYRGVAVDASILRDASAELVAGASQERPAWTELAQCEHIHGVQLLLLAGDVDAAASKLRSKKKFSRIHTYYTWHGVLIEFLRSARDHTSLKAHFDSYFDQVRDPYFAELQKTTGDHLLGLALIRLRLALIRWIYIERKPIAGNWRHIIGQIGY